jgi:hypothetical protein
MSSCNYQNEFGSIFVSTFDGTDSPELGYWLAIQPHPLSKVWVYATHVTATVASKLHIQPGQTLLLACPAM